MVGMDSWMAAFCSWIKSGDGGLVVGSVGRLEWSGVENGIKKVVGYQVQSNQLCNINKQKIFFRILFLLNTIALLMSVELN